MSGSEGRRANGVFDSRIGATLCHLDYPGDWAIDVASISLFNQRMLDDTVEVDTSPA